MELVFETDNRGKMVMVQRLARLDTVAALLLELLTKERPDVIGSLQASDTPYTGRPFLYWVLYLVLLLATRFLLYPFDIKKAVVCGLPFHIAVVIMETKLNR